MVISGSFFLKSFKVLSSWFGFVRGAEVELSCFMHANQPLATGLPHPVRVFCLFFQVRIYTSDCPGTCSIVQASLDCWPLLGLCHHVQPMRVFLLFKNSYLKLIKKVSVLIFFFFF